MATTPLTIIRSAMSHFQSTPGLASHLLPSLKVISATSTVANFSMRVDPIHLNSWNGLHGGCSSSIIDICSSMAVLAATDGVEAGVSTDLQLSFLNPAREGDVLDITSTCDRHGRMLAYTHSTIRVGEKIIARGSYTKYIGRKQGRHDAGSS